MVHLQKRQKRLLMRTDTLQLYSLLIPGVIFIFIFAYMPMYGAQIAFRDFSFRKGYFDSPWVGLKHFARYVSSANFWLLMKNTLGLSVTNLVFGFPVPVILAFLLNELRSPRFKKTVQMITYIPHFISTVAICSMITLFTDRSSGVINRLIMLFGGEARAFLAEPACFKPIFVISSVWQEMGWGTIIYLAALSGVDPQMLEAATIDGANRLQKIVFINLPSIWPTICVMLILSIGSLLNVGYEKVLLLQNNLNMEASDVISTYVYRLGIKDAQYSYTTAIGLFNSVINIILLVSSNWIIRRLSGSSLF